MKYLILSNLIIALSYLLYMALYKKQSFHQANRWFLLLGLASAVVIPIMPVEFSKAVVSDSFAENTVLLEAFNTVGVESDHSSSVLSWITVYLLGVSVMAFWFLFKFVRTIKATFFEENYLVDHQFSAYSFFRTIKIGDAYDEVHRNMISDHELVHQRQLHTLDILFFELAKIFFWFNPFIYLMNNEIQLVHEFIADEETNQKYGTDYQYTLLNQAIDTKVFPLTNSFFNQSLIKQRIMKMNEKRSPKSRLFLYALAIPAIGLSVTMHACSEESAMEEAVTQTSPEMKENGDIQITPSQEVDVHPTFIGGEQALYAFLGENIKYPEELKELNLEQVRVFTQFIVDVDGSVKKVEIMKSDDDRFNESAIAAISSMPNWEPAVKDGKPVAVKYHIPINYKLQ